MTATERERWRAKAEASTSGRTNSDAAKQNARSGRSNEQRLQVGPLWQICHAVMLSILSPISDNRFSSSSGAKMGWL